MSSSCQAGRDSPFRHCNCQIDIYIVIMKSQHLHRLIWMSRPLMQSAEACVEHGLEGTQLTVRMRAVLEILLHHGPQSVPDLAAKLEIKRQYVQLMVNDTLAAGLIEPRENPRHKRSKILALNDAGQTLIEQIIAEEMGLMEDIGHDLSEQDIETALQVILAITQKLKAVSGGRK